MGWEEAKTPLVHHSSYLQSVEALRIVINDFSFRRAAQVFAGEVLVDELAHAAEYVYLLDPWWNPAVEAQAIDRAHRIGQTRQVFAYRLIARDTVEEKVLELQKAKRDLADAIISADNSVVRNLTREDLELLLS